MSQSCVLFSSDGDSVYANTMRDAFAAISRQLEGFTESESGGTTIAACLVLDGEQTDVRRLVTANLGDAQAILWCARAACA